MALQDVPSPWGSLPGLLPHPANPQQLPELSVVLLHLLQGLGIDLLLKVLCSLAAWGRRPFYILQSYKGRQGRVGVGS